MKFKAYNLIINIPFYMYQAVMVSEDSQFDVEVQIGARNGIDIAEHPRTVYYGQNREWWNCVLSSDRILFNCPAGEFDIIEGRKIVITPYPNTIEEQIGTYIMGSALGGIQTQIGRIPLHGGSVVFKDKAIVITGEQGTGKSTMVSSLVHLGYKYLSDDVSAIAVSSDLIPVVIPSSPQRKLVKDACCCLGYHIENLTIVDYKRNKYVIPDYKNWCKTPVRFSSLVKLILVKKGTKVELQKVKGINKLFLLAESLYRRWMLSPGGKIEPQTMKKLLSLANSVNMFIVYVPQDIDNALSTAEQVAEVLGLIRED